MTHNEVMKKWIWKWYAETMKLGFQCVAWVKKYCSEMGYPIRSFWGSAINGWLTGSPFDLSWRKVKYTWFNSPSEWDIIFWSEGRVRDGHVAVANKFCNLLVLRYTDQNGGWNEESIQPRFTWYRNVLGWYTRK